MGYFKKFQKMTMFGKCMKAIVIIMGLKKID